VIGGNALLVAKEHGHRPLTMLTVYAAWTEGAPKRDIRALRAARNPKEAKTIWHWEGTGTPSDGVISTRPASSLRPFISGTFSVPDRSA
jgi:hypothetical protein